MKKGYQGLRYDGGVWLGNRCSYNFVIFSEPNKILTPIGVYPLPPEARLNAISMPTIRTIQVLGVVGTVASIGIATHKVVTSEAPVKETVHQGMLLSAGFWGGMKAGQLALLPCSEVGAFWPPAAPFVIPGCVALASIVGGAGSTFIADSGWNVLTNKNES